MKVIRNFCGFTVTDSGKETCSSEDHENSQVIHVLLEEYTYQVVGKRGRKELVPISCHNHSRFSIGSSKNDKNREDEGGVLKDVHSMRNKSILSRRDDEN